MAWRTGRDTEAEQDCGGLGSQGSPVPLHLSVTAFPSPIVQSGLYPGVSAPGGRFWGLRVPALGPSQGLGAGLPVCVPSCVQLGLWSLGRLVYTVPGCTLVSVYGLSVLRAFPKACEEGLGCVEGKHGQAEGGAPAHPRGKGFLTSCAMVGSWAGGCSLGRSSGVSRVPAPPRFCAEEASPETRNW